MEKYAAKVSIWLIEKFSKTLEEYTIPWETIVNLEKHNQTQLSLLELPCVNILAVKNI